jgi:predicted ATPase
VTLTGAGGVGKTRLALQAAGQVAVRFADGAWLCELAPVLDSGGVDDAVEAVFSVTAPAGQAEREARMLCCARQSLDRRDRVPHERPDHHT